MAPGEPGCTAPVKSMSIDNSGGKGWALRGELFTGQGKVRNLER
jgi:hypothetical protein